MQAWTISLRFPWQRDPPACHCRHLGPLSQARERSDHFCSLPECISSCVIEVTRHSGILLANGRSMPLAALLSSSACCSQTSCDFSTRSSGLQSRLMRLSLPLPPPCFGRMQCLVELSTGNILFRVPYNTGLELPNGLLF